jgi:hypothetical protein
MTNYQRTYESLFYECDDIIYNQIPKFLLGNIKTAMDQACTIPGR